MVTVPRMRGINPFIVETFYIVCSWDIPRGGRRFTLGKFAIVP